jgi:MoaA/NifB/PqqE/SkfB family radical SAM enzyme
VILGKLKTAWKMRRSLSADRPRPLTVAVNITGGCNLRCEFCEKSRSPAGADIPLEHVCRLIDLAASLGSGLFFAGGEPFLHKDFWGILEHARSVGKKVQIVTNGTQLDHLSPDQLDLLGQTVDIMWISIDSADPDEHDRIRGMKGAFDRAVGFIRNPRRRNPVEILAVLTAEIHRVRPLIDLAHELGCSIIFQPIMFASNYPDQPRLEYKEKLETSLPSAAEQAKELSSLARYARKLSVKTNLRFLAHYVPTYFRSAGGKECFQDRLLGKFLCVTPFQRLIVDENGVILPCALLPGERSIFEGDIYENWRRTALKYRQALRSGVRYAACASCSCHFNENFKGSVLAHPLRNWRHLLWLLGYHLRKK